MVLLQNWSNNRRTIAMAVRSRVVLLFFLSCFWSSGISAQEPIMETSIDSDAQERILDEITIIGQSLHSLGMKMNKAEEIKFEIFNSLNSTDDFDIKCEYVAHTQYNSIIKRRECDVGYMKKAREEDARLFMDSVQYDLPFLHRSEQRRAVELADKTEALNKEMVELGMKHPSLVKAMVDEIELKQRYIIEQRERYKDSILIGHTKPEDYFGDELKFLDFAYSAYLDGMMEEGIWNYWDRRLRSVILYEPYRSIWLSSNKETFAAIFMAYVNGILR